MSPRRGFLTPEEHEEQRERARRLIADGTVSSWAQLGAMFGISGQAARQRFGRGGYGLTMPARRRRYQRAITVVLSDETFEWIDELRRERRVSRASVVRELLEQHWSDDVQSRGTSSR